jgi:hypothetical protein
VVFSNGYDLLSRAKLQPNKLSLSGWMKARNRKLLINDIIHLKGFSPPSFPSLSSLVRRNFNKPDKLCFMQFNTPH